MTNRTRIGAVMAAVVLALGAATVHGWAGQSNTITFNRAVALPGVVLPAGSYEFTVVNSPSSTDIVRVTSDHGRRAHYMGFTQPLARPRPSRDGQPIVLGESPAGTPPPIAAWYPVDGDNGHRFIY